MPSAPQPPFFVEPSPAGGYRVMMREHHRPVSRHDTEEDAVHRMAAYRRGWENAQAERHVAEQSRSAT